MDLTVRRASKFAAVAEIASALLLSSGCAVPMERVGDTTPIVLAEPWSAPSATWTENGTVRNIVKFPENIGYSVLDENKNEKFFIYSPEGKEVAHVSTVDSPERYKMKVTAEHRDGKITVTVSQILDTMDVWYAQPPVDLVRVETDFDEDGKKIAERRKYYDPVEIQREWDESFTSRYSPASEPSEKKEAGVFDGVTLSTTDVMTPEGYPKTVLSGPGWKRDFLYGAHPTSLGSYVYVQQKAHPHDPEPTLFSSKEHDLCRVIDPRTGEDVQLSVMATSCSLQFADEVSLDAGSRVINHGGTNRDSISGDLEPIMAGVLLPSEGKSREFEMENFSPYSVDTDGTIYGVLAGRTPASTPIGSGSYPVSLTDERRAPVEITSSGIAVFPIQGVEKKDGPMVFAVK